MTFTQTHQGRRARALVLACLSLVLTASSSLEVSRLDREAPAKRSA